LGLVFLYYFRNIVHVLMHMLVLFLFSYAFLQAYLLVNPQMPSFSAFRFLSTRIRWSTSVRWWQWRC
jgi:hypothetical protein